jgi:hypothetical protein
MLRSSRTFFSDCDLAENNSFPIKIPIRQGGDKSKDGKNGGVHLVFFERSKYKVFP